jgi:hypothetical protein
MFLLTFIVLGVAIVIVRLVTEVRNDRSLTPPRSHADEISVHPTRQSIFS